MALDVVRCDIRNDHVIAHLHVDEKLLSIMRQAETGAAVGRTIHLSLKRVVWSNLQNRQAFPAMIRSIHGGSFSQPSDAAARYWMKNCDGADLSLCGVCSAQFDIFSGICRRSHSYGKRVRRMRINSQARRRAIQLPALGRIKSKLSFSSAYR